MHGKAVGRIFGEMNGHINVVGDARHQMFDWLDGLLECAVRHVIVAAHGLHDGVWLVGDIRKTMGTGWTITRRHTCLSDESQRLKADRDERKSI